MSQVNYPKPKIFLIDVVESALRSLVDRGYNVSSGTFGRPYRVKKSSSFLPVMAEAVLSNHAEQEIVIVDLAAEVQKQAATGEKHRPDDEIDLWAKCDQGYIDPRARSAFIVHKAFDRILKNGGVFVVFANRKSDIEFVLARKGPYGLYDEKEFPHDEWHFVSDLAGVTVSDDEGTEMRSTDGGPLGRLVARFLKNSGFSCSLNARFSGDNPWLKLVENKFGQPVGVYRSRGTEGSIIVLPQIADKDGFLKELIEHVLPEIAPHLFPDLQRGRWTRFSEYELPRIVQLQKQQLAIRERARREIEDLDLEIDQERSKDGWLHNLLVGTDADLVKAVEKSFGVLGFTNVVDIDAERDNEGKSRREDLQVRDVTPTLVIDIKGIGGFPSDEDVLQADKHSAIRMREERRTDFVGLSIINHQRHLPPLERDNEMPFRQELIDAAEERTLGLLTAWDLYRLIRNYRKLGWSPKLVQPLFYSKGRIDIVPKHYQFLGRIAKAWTDKFGVVIENGELNLGDKVAVEFPIEFEEVDVASIRIKDKNVEKAGIGAPAGLLWNIEKPKLRAGLRVFRVDVRPTS